MKKDMIVTVASIILSLAGLACFAVCIARHGENQTLLCVGFALNTTAFLLSFVSRKKDK